MYYAMPIPAGKVPVRHVVATTTATLLDGFGGWHAFCGVWLVPLVMIELSCAHLEINLRMM